MGLKGLKKKKAQCKTASSRTSSSINTFEVRRGLHESKNLITYPKCVVCGGKRSTTFGQDNSSYVAAPYLTLVLLLFILFFLQEQE